LRAHDLRYLPADHAEAVAAKQRALSLWPLDPQRWRYDHTARAESGWTHALLCARRGGTDRWRRVPASPGWDPPEGEYRARPAGRRGIIDGLRLGFTDPTAGRKRVRAALLPRVLRRGIAEEPGGEQA